MRELFSSELFHVRKSGVLKLLLIGAFVSGILMPLFFYGIMGFLNMVQSNADFAGMEELQPMLDSISSITGYLTADNIFMMVIPIAEGFGLIICGAICFYNAQQFSNGIIRNKIITGKSRSSIYLSMFGVSAVLSVISALLYMITAALMSRLCFGEFTISFGDIVTIVAISTLGYMTYAAIQTFASFATKSVPFAMIICILLPIVTNTVFSIMGPFIATMPEEVLPVCAIFPTFQMILVVNKLTVPAVFIVSVIADVVWMAAITILGIVQFKRTDIK